MLYNLLSSQNHEDDDVWLDTVETQEEDVLIKKEINSQKKDLFCKKIKNCVLSCYKNFTNRK